MNSGRDVVVKALGPLLDGPEEPLDNVPTEGHMLPSKTKPIQNPRIASQSTRIKGLPTHLNKTFLMNRYAFKERW